jgi:hypothetical protein
MFPARRNPCWIVLRPYSVAVVVVGHQVAAVVGHRVAAAGAGHRDALTVRESASLSRSTPRKRTAYARM